MRLVKVLGPTGHPAVGLWEREEIWPLDVAVGRQYQSLADILEAPDPVEVVGLLTDRSRAPWRQDQVRLLAPVDEQEVWGAGVTYLRSRAARMEESEDAASFYDKVYGASRPELFFKATPHRVAGPGQPVRVRRDTRWCVPEPELALVLNSRLRLVGFTVGNDMSARDIEGENPLYLPQAKLYDACCGLGPCIRLATAASTAHQSEIELTVRRRGEVVVQDATNTSKMARSFEDLIQWLGRDNSFPQGVILLTGTGIVPREDFTLEPHDQVEIRIEGIGTLVNPVIRD